MSNESADFVVRRLFTAGLALGSCVRLLDRDRGKRITAVISELDEIGRDVRRTALVEGRAGPHLGGDPHRQALVTGMSHVVAEITSRLDALGRSDSADDVPSPHLLDAIQSLERALAYLRDGTEQAPAAQEPVRPRHLRPAAGIPNGRGPQTLHVATERSG